MQSSPIKTRLLLIALGIGIGMMVVVCSVFLFSGWVFGSLRSESDYWSSSEGVAKLAEFEYPPTAQILDSSTNAILGGQAWDAHASFNMAPSDLDAFIASTKIEAPWPSTGVPTSAWVVGKPISKDICPYDLRDTTPHLFGKEFRDNSRSIRHRFFFIDMSNPEIYTVYVCIEYAQ